MRIKCFYSGIFLLHSLSPGSNLDMRTHELTYAFSSNMEGKAHNGSITCRPIKDTSITGISVVQYRYIKKVADSSDTSFNYLNITDTSVINYAWRGNAPYVLLKSAAADDSLNLEETPYTTFAFPFKLNARWLTRPDTTGLQSQKEFVGQESITTPAGTFYCNKVHTDILISFHLTDLYGDQWSIGNTVIKSFIHEGVSVVSDEVGNFIDSSENWELFELTTARQIEPAAISKSNKYTEHNIVFAKDTDSYGMVALNGRIVYGQRFICKGVYLIRKNKGAKVLVDFKKK